jgi:hypothetical protein
MTIFPWERQKDSQYFSEFLSVLCFVKLKAAIEPPFEIIDCGGDQSSSEFQVKVQYESTLQANRTAKRNIRCYTQMNDCLMALT